MSGHSFFYSRRTDFLQEDLMKRWLDHLEALHGCARLDNAPQQRLRIGTRCQLDLEESV
jgi:hypothetical protein